MPRNDDGLVGHPGEVFVRRAYLTVDTASGRIVDEWIKTVPECVARVEYVGIDKVNGNVRIRMRIAIVPEHCGRTIYVDFVLVMENRRRKGRRWRGGEREVPCLNSGITRKTLAGIFMSNYGCPCIVQPRIAVRMVKVPVSIDQMLDRIGADGCERITDFWTRTDITGVNKKLTVTTGQNGNVSSRTRKDAYVAAKFLDCDAAASR